MCSKIFNVVRSNNILLATCVPMFAMYRTAAGREPRAPSSPGKARAPGEWESLAAESPAGAHGPRTGSSLTTGAVGHACFGVPCGLSVSKLLLPNTVHTVMLAPLFVLPPRVARGGSRS